jgi:hypothetical protein
MQGVETKPKRKPMTENRSPQGGQAEVESFFTANGGTKDQAEDFFLHYEANGWVQGKTPLKQWPMAARKWIKGGSFPKQTTKSSHRNPEPRQIQEVIDIPIWKP